jgi:hypothetical protein
MPDDPDYDALTAELRAALQSLDEAFLVNARHDDTPDAARHLIGRLADHLEGGLPLHPRVFEHMVAALRAVAEGADPAQALHLKLPRGKRARATNSANTRLRDPAIYFEVQRLVDEGMRPYRSQARLDKPSACSTLAERYGFDEKHIEAIYAKLRKDFA